MLLLYLLDLLDRYDLESEGRGDQKVPATLATESSYRYDGHSSVHLLGSHNLSLPARP